MQTVTRKLVSRKGGPLGTITYPAEWEAERRLPQRRGFLRVVMWQPVGLADLEASSVEVEIDTFVIHDAFHPEHPGAVMLEGVSLEAFERQPHCSFAPGAAYLRSLVE